MAQYLLDVVYSLTNCICCFPPSPRLKIKNRSFKILRLLGEGGFSYVYLVQDVSNESLHALKKIRCPFGQESVTQALKEVEAYTLFAPHPNIIQSEDYSVVADKSDASAKIVYILLPYYRRGNLQDMINANLINHTRFPERRLMVLFLGVCRALKAMHQYRAKGGSGGVGDGRGGDSQRKKARKIRANATRADDDAREEVARKGRRQHQQQQQRQDGGGGGLNGDVDTEQEPLMEGEVTRAQEGLAEGEIRAYAHRDVKPGNIMISDDGRTPILMDLGSISPSPITITSRSLALAVQDTAAEHSTMPYRAPELFDVKTGSVIDTKVDIWSLGCTLYACLVGKSPFEARSEETGGSLGLCILGGDWRFPDEGRPQRRNESNKGKGKAKSGGGGGGVGDDGNVNANVNANGSWSEPVREVVRRCLKVEPAERPDIDELIEIVEGVVDGLGGDEEDDEEDVE